ncbi:glycosyltransferase family protein [Pectinatus sottacetonis]|uniref:hypothetical protein n=1 Tax=Pectinatus sottacetonis TaxID=1002795 RepID=UPI0018C6BEEF|nr:hypothetical protein [Pectinatus sottacetonis]
MNKLKLMYISNISWSWIKQRPQFLAEGLSKYYEVDVYSRKAYRKSKMVENTTNKVSVYDIFRLPYEKVKFIEMFSNKIVGYQLKKKLKKYDIIWISDPRDYLLIKKHVSANQSLIFDCMDDYAEFPIIKLSQQRLIKYLNAERSLLLNSTQIFVSSFYLSKTLQKRNNLHISSKIEIINNAICEEKIKIEKNKSDFYHLPHRKKIITYIGTISSWLDMSLIINSLNIYDDIEYHMYGPKDIELPKHERLKYLGILDHNEVFEVMAEADMLIMPFLLTPLVMSVNPVKLYEYIQADKPVVSIKYDETEQFADYVYLYSTQDEYFCIIKKLIDNRLNALKSKEETLGFLKKNTWDNRIIKIIKKMKNG